MAYIDLTFFSSCFSEHPYSHHSPLFPHRPHPQSSTLFVSFVSLTSLAHISSLTRHMSIGTTLLSTDSLTMYGPCIKYEYILIIAAETLNCSLISQSNP